MPGGPPVSVPSSIHWAMPASGLLSVGLRIEFHVTKSSEYSTRYDLPMTNWNGMTVWPEELRVIEVTASVLRGSLGSVPAASSNKSGWPSPSLSTYCTAPRTKLVEVWVTAKLARLLVRLTRPPLGALL